ncbi:adenine phosphoribosyltransferase [Fonsecaea monophora]|uniref:adenine phosphoribosyltransferase n=2 Tax=Fonsecaea TaxID=40354 RepID=A0A0D2EU99_9EURO|nr:adenine phosphoribosyltransferase [Fonsecaea pedrosoi CBS 271.37]XP_022510861.1 adenine phosphoribosyltransferase [Fonsecaea monophora]KAH0841170.1 Adenine phosphoribosyltransferase [Fonsecaea pedrosoi]KIW77822.1 adenine phosphoribosyltransferase [Fonsecaea pedrosoi CBS 271.37]OAG38909.1 adenine phosphoribosyltransferase [Fonsecaea monophora]
MTLSADTDCSHGTARPEPNATASTSQLTRSQTLSELKTRIKAGLKTYPDFPKKGILFEDILPLFASHTLHEDLIRAFELQIAESLGPHNIPDVIVGLDARGFLIGPTLALRFGAGFVPVRKAGKLPGEIETAEYQKEYGTDTFAMQTSAIQPGQKVLVVDDLIATGGSAAAAGTLVEKCGGQLLGYIFIIELTFLNGRDKLNAPVFTLLESQED